MKKESWLNAGFSFMVGLVWGLALARILSLSLHSVFFSNWPGTFLSCLLGIGVSTLLATCQQHTTTENSWNITSLSPLLLPLLSLFGDYHPWRASVLLSGSLLLAIAFTFQHLIPHGLEGALAAIIPLVVYLPDISPYVGRADTFEFQVIAPQLGIAHPSGYPLYTLIAKLFSWLPFGSNAWRVNLSSAIFSAAASYTLYRVLQEVSTHIDRVSTTSEQRRTQRLLSLLVAFTLAFTPTLWSRAIEAEVYTLNAFLVTLALWLAVRWSSGRMKTAIALPLFGLLVGTAMSSHLTLGALLLIAIPLIINVKPRPKLRTFTHAISFGMAGLALYLYIPMRWPAVTGGQTMTFTHFLSFVTNAESGGALRPWAFYQDPARWALVFRLIKAQVGWIGLALALVGIIILFRRRWPLALGSFMALSTWIWFNLGFYVADPDYSAFLIPGHVVLIFWIGIGVLTLHTWLSSANKAPMSTHRASISQLALPVCISLLVLLPMSRLWHTGPSLNKITQGHADEAWGRYALQQDLATDAAVLADSEKFPPLYYLQQIEGLRPDLELVTLFNEAQYREALETRLARGQRVYMARYLPGLDAFGVSAVGPLVEVSPPPQAIPDRPPYARFGRDGAIALEEYRLEPDTEGRTMHHLSLVWHTLQNVDLDLEVRLRLVGAEKKNVVWELPPTRPVAGYTTTQSWSSGTRVQDYHPLAWPNWVPGGNYTIEVGLFPRFTDQGLTYNANGESWYPLTQVMLPQPDRKTPNQQLNVRFGEHTWLIGADLPSETWADATLSIDLTWQRQRAVAGETTLQAYWITAEGRSEIYSATSPTADYALWPQSWPQRTETTLRYTIPTPKTPGHYRLELAWAEHKGEINAVQCRWLGVTRQTCPIGEVNVGPANAGLANFDNQILLLDARLDADNVPAGGMLQVTATWRGLRKLDHDYTVFVQVLGEDGKLYGQVDSWPVQGARPTSTWSVGEELEDPYNFYLAENTPSGQYRVIIGWYLLADMRRLIIRDVQGRAIGNFYEVGQFTIP